MDIKRIRELTKQGKGSAAERVKIATELWEGPVKARILHQAELGEFKASFKEAAYPVLVALAVIAQDEGYRASVINDRYAAGKILLLSWAEDDEETQ